MHHWKIRGSATYRARTPSCSPQYVKIVKVQCSPPRLLYIILLITCLRYIVKHRSATHSSSEYQTAQVPNGSDTCDHLRLRIDDLVDRTLPSRLLPFDSDGVGRLNISGWVGANALMNQCWKYEDRFRNYETMPDRYAGHNRCNNISRSQKPEQTRSVFVIRIGETQKWTKDIILSVRALVAEVGWRQRTDVFILQHLNRSAALGVSVNLVPEEFRPFTLQFSMDNIMVDYEPGVIAPIDNPPMNIPVMAQFNHMAETYFMRKFPEYDFGWFAEIDVRLIGRWDTFLNHIDLTMSRKVPQGKSIDLISFTPSYKADRSWLWANSMMKFPLSELTMSLLQVHRVSRALVDKMHEHHLAGNNAYFEGFMTTVATMAGLNKFIYANPVFADVAPAITGKPFTGIATVNLSSGRLHPKNLYLGNLEEEDEAQERKVLYHGATYSPQNMFAGKYYSQWKSSSDICRPVSLVHPVK